MTGIKGMLSQSFPRNWYEKKKAFQAHMRLECLLYLSDSFRISNAFFSILETYEREIPSAAATSRCAIGFVPPNP
jgi:hypothetical protein